MAINFNPSVSSLFVNNNIKNTQSAQASENKVDFKKAFDKGINKVNKLHHEADTSIVDLLSG